MVKFGIKDSSNHLSVTRHKSFEGSIYGVGVGIKFKYNFGI